jgi:hypothetical protein
VGCPVTILCHYSEWENAGGDETPREEQVQSRKLRLEVEKLPLGKRIPLKGAVSSGEEIRNDLGHDG